MLVTNDDALVIKADDTRIGDGDTEDIAREVFKYGLLALSPDRAMDNPWPRPRGLWQNQIGPAFLERGPELAAEEFGQGLFRDEKGVTRWMPVVTVIGDAASIGQYGAEGSLPTISALRLNQRCRRRWLKSPRPRGPP